MNGVLVSGTYSTLAHGQLVTFVAASPFSPDDLVEVFSLPSLRDEFGRPLAGPELAKFRLPAPTTQYAYAAEISPESARDVPRNVRPQVRYTQPLDPTTVNGTNVSLGPLGPASPLPGAVSLDASGTIVTFVPASPLAAGTSFSLRLTNLRTALGMSVGDFSFLFTTSNDVDTAPPALASFVPGNGATGVGLNAAILLGFSEPANRLTINAVTATASQGGAPLPLRIAVSSDDRSATLSFVRAPVAGQPISWMLNGVADWAGNPLPAFTGTFVPGSDLDFRPPLVVRWSPAYAMQVPINARVTFELDEAIGAANMRLYEPAASTYVAGTVSRSGRTATFVPAAPLAAGHVYYAPDLSFRDSAGNLVSSYGTASFTASLPMDTTPPVILSVSANEGATGVARNIAIAVQASEPLDAARITSMVTLTPAGGSPMEVAAVVAPDQKSFTIRPMSLLPPNVAVTLTIDVSDLAGNTTVAPVVRHFTTGPGGTIQ